MSRTLSYGPEHTVRTCPEKTVPVSWGSQSWLPPAFSRRSVDATRVPSRLERRLQATLPAPLYFSTGWFWKLFRNRHLGLGRGRCDAPPGRCRRWLEAQLGSFQGEEGGVKKNAQAWLAPACLRVPMTVLLGSISRVRPGTSCAARCRQTVRGSGREIRSAVPELWSARRRRSRW
jgi:hypothetical protein